MTREHFVRLVEEALDSLPERFRQHVQNVAVLVEDYPAAQRPRRAGTPPRPARLPRVPPGHLLLGVYVGVPLTKRSVFDLRTGPDHIILYQKNIEAVCGDDSEIRHQVRQTVMHELGHYFGMSEDQLRDV